MEKNYIKPIVSIKTISSSENISVTVEVGNASDIHYGSSTATENDPW